MAPPPALSISGIAYFIPNKVPVTLTAMILSNDSSGNWCKGVDGWAEAIPALLTR